MNDNKAKQNKILLTLLKMAIDKCIENNYSDISLKENELTQRVDVKFYFGDTSICVSMCEID